MAKKPVYTVCAICKDPIKQRHLVARGVECVACDWFWCSRCQWMTERSTGRSMSWAAAAAK